MAGSVQNRPIGISILDLDSIMLRVHGPKTVSAGIPHVGHQHETDVFSIYDVNSSKTGWQSLLA